MAERLHSTLAGAMQKFSPEFRTRADERDAEDRNVLKARAKAYAKVNVRDRDRCRACFRQVGPDKSRKLHREHHHVTGRGGVKKETTGNICLLCVGCHELTYIKRTLKIAGNADGALRIDTGTKRYVSLPPNVVLKLATGDQP
jgi:hypothetical protein